MLPAEHFGATQTRKWYKVRWVKNPPGMKVEGIVDLVQEEDLPKFREFVEILTDIRAAKCTAGIRLGYGKTSEKEIDKWMELKKVRGLL